MTDTVNVPRDDDSRSFSDSLLPEAMIWAGIEVQEQVDRDNANYIAGETTDWDQGMIAVAIYRAMLAAAPKAEPDYRNLVRDMDRMHEDGTIPPEAPKVEQEPCATCGGRGHLMWEGGDSAKSVTEYEDCPTCSHPAPASDELLEALGAVRKALIPCGVLNDNVRKALAIADSAIAKHKGPQS